ncbi:MAG: hypothetical protein AB1649_16795 [Chloroflexota bacterium]
MKFVTIPDRTCPSYNKRMEDWLTTYEAAQISGYNPDYIRQLIRANKVIGRKWGLSWQVQRKSLQEYMKKAEKLGERRGAKPKPDSKRR